MRNDLVRDLRSAHTRFWQIHGVQVEHAVAFQNVERVAKRADHGMVAHAIDFIEPGNNGERGAQRSPVLAAEFAVHAEGENAAAGIRRTEAKTFHNSFHLLSVLQQLKRIITLGIFDVGILGSSFRIPLGLCDGDLLPLSECRRVGVIGAAGIAIVP
jgi:hypothetical protein